MRTYVFGPVPSRRLGISLGVDLTPTKTCSYDCIYCQLSRTKFLTAKRDRFCPPHDVINELREVLSEIATPDWVTFSGTGEPTLNVDLGFIIAELKKFTQAPVCVITNSSLIHLEEVRNDLLLADRILPTLTTVRQSTFVRIHRPAPGIELNDTLTGLKLFSEKFSGTIEVEIFVIPGINDSDEEISGLHDFIETMPGISSIYLNTSVRAPLENEVITADQGRLDRFREKLNLRIPVSTAFEHNLIPLRPANWNRENAGNEILKLLLRHPCNHEQICQVLGIDPARLTTIIKQLLDENKIIRRENGDYHLPD
ncbi:MAG: radical SAM protein [Candidatus Rifleibacteriota bacterium]